MLSAEFAAATPWLCPQGGADMADVQLVFLDGRPGRERLALLTRAKWNHATPWLDRIEWLAGTLHRRTQRQRTRLCDCRRRGCAKCRLDVPWTANPAMGKAGYVAALFRWHGRGR